MMQIDDLTLRNGLPAWDHARPNIATAVLRGLVEAGAVNVEVGRVDANPSRRGPRYIIDFAGGPDADAIVVRVHANLTNGGEVARWLNTDPKFIEVFESPDDAGPIDSAPQPVIVTLPVCACKLERTRGQHAKMCEFYTEETS
ncbi:hypothetical protein [Actinomadura atramentaria]|uniref:hypothetical protein n=1 Tax=Actinomadura atramentaria TaxID=1990 RepID=UPI00037F71CF|nr:hypothetical protein [Actinomadura atramentaria]